jgi:hypothetical protein
MSSTFTTYPKYAYAVVLAVLIPTLVLHWYAYGDGLILTDDSNHYLTSASSFHELKTLTNEEGHHFLFWPPLFPIVLSAFQSPQQQLVWLHLMMVAVFSVFLFWIIRHSIRSFAVAVFCFIAVMMGVHILLISTFLWSELLFLLLTTAFLYSLIKSPTNRFFYIIALIIGFLMCMQRNAGLFIAFGAALWLYVQNLHMKNSFLRASAFFFAIISGSLIWNSYIWGYLPHPHFSFSEPWFQHGMHNFTALCFGIINAFLPVKALPSLLAPVSAFFIVWWLRRHIRQNSVIQLVFMVSMSYLLFFAMVLVVNVAGFKIDYGEGDRFVAVILPFLAILVFKTLETIIGQQRRRLRLIFMVLLTIWMIYPLARAVKNANQWHRITTVSP